MIYNAHTHAREVSSKNDRRRNKHKSDEMIRIEQRENSLIEVS